ncbi:DUF6065 family protein [Mesorhizobium marinum]|uniref:DUF6065 family protein n=1 Tax=Mesorhizobium marinum TaxID=3228790 RepID=UPI003467395C
MELVCYVRDGNSDFEIVPAPSRRDWMDAAHERSPYRCLPLVMANRHGWDILCPVGFTAIWNGGPAIDGVVILEDRGTAPPAVSHFGEGILTFRMPLLFRTDPGTDLIVQGPVNRPKDAIAALTGVIESDWGPFSFTMNWKFTRAKTAIRFEKGEPFCSLTLARRGALEEVRPKFLPMSDDPELDAAHAEWLASRERFNEDLKVKGSAARKAGWQKHYQRGVDLHGNVKPFPHLTKTNLHPFEPIE